MNPIKRRIFTIPELKIVRTSDPKQEFTQWTITGNNKTYKLYPKIFLLLSGLLLSIGFLESYSNKNSKRKEGKKLHEKIVSETEDKYYALGTKHGIESITSGKVDPNVLKSYVDMIVYIDTHKKLKASAVEMEQERLQYIAIMNNIQ